MFVGLLARTRFFSSAHRSSIELRSGLCDGHSNTLTLLSILPQLWKYAWGHCSFGRPICDQALTSWLMSWDVASMLPCIHLNRKVVRRSFLWANVVIKLCQSLATGNSEKNKVDSWRQWYQGQSSRKRSEFPTWNFKLDDRSKRILQVGASSQLSSTDWSLRFHSSEFPVVLLDWQHGQCMQPFLAHGVECLPF